jgi:hypothetical protein
MRVTRTIRQVAEKAMSDMLACKNGGEDDIACQHILANAIGGVLTAERTYIAEMVEDFPVMEQLADNANAESICGAIAEKLDARNALPVVVVDEGFREFDRRRDPCQRKQFLIKQADQVINRLRNTQADLKNSTKDEYHTGGIERAVELIEELVTHI